jgi:cobalt-zinc-cadmium efflux system protein
MVTLHQSVAMHDHGHDHNHEGHHHRAVSAADATNRAFICGVILNSAYVVVEAVMGFANHSMSLLSDAGHNLGDVAGLILSLAAFRLAKVKPTGAYTYGYKKTTILAALANAVILLVSVGLLGYESVVRLSHPVPLEGGTMAIVAGIGILVNFGSALLFMRNTHELNSRSAYLHLMADAAVSLGVVLAGIAIQYTGWYWLDGAVSIIILIVILFSTWSLLVHSLRLSMDAVPEDIHIKDIEEKVMQINGVRNMHHTHVWAISTSENALTAHIVLNDSLPFDEKVKLVQHIKHELLHMNIAHATLELESGTTDCAEELCDVRV